MLENFLQQPCTHLLMELTQSMAEGQDSALGFLGSCPKPLGVAGYTRADQPKPCCLDRSRSREKNHSVEMAAHSIIHPFRGRHVEGDYGKTAFLLLKRI